jgi:hypothetical protein
VVRWLAIALNVALLFSEAVLFFDRGVAMAPLEIALVSLFVATPIVSLAMFLDYNRRRL